MESRPSDFELEVIGFKVLVLSLNRAAPTTSTPTSAFRSRSRGFELEPSRPATNGGVFVLRDGQSHTTFKEGPVLATKRSFGQPTQISRSIAAALGSFRRSDHVRQLRGEACVARLDVSGQSRGDLLEHPAVVVRIAERGVRGVTFSLRIWAVD